MIRAHITMSLDGYVAGPDQNPEQPLGTGGEELHEWAFATRAWLEAHGRSGGEGSVDSDVIAAETDNVGAHIMGRKMFDGGEGSFDPAWKGWWGDDPPYHTPVFVLTHHEREPIEMEGGTTFHFVTDGVESAVAQAREAAGDKDVAVIGGAAAIDEVLKAGLLDELRLHVVPRLLGGGSRLFEGVGTPALEQVEAIPSEIVTHLRYRVVR